MNDAQRYKLLIVSFFEDVGLRQIFYNVPFVTKQLHTLGIWSIQFVKQNTDIREITREKNELVNVKSVRVIKNGGRGKKTLVIFPSVLKP